MSTGRKSQGPDPSWAGAAWEGELGEPRGPVLLLKLLCPSASRPCPPPLHQWSHRWSVRKGGAQPWLGTGSPPPGASTCSPPHPHPWAATSTRPHGLWWPAGGPRATTPASSARELCAYSPGPGVGGISWGGGHRQWAGGTPQEGQVLKHVVSGGQGPSGRRSPGPTRARPRTCRSGHSRPSPPSTPGTRPG